MEIYEISGNKIIESSFVKKKSGNIKGLIDDKDENLIEEDDDDYEEEEDEEEDDDDEEEEDDDEDEESDDMEEDLTNKKVKKTLKGINIHISSPYSGPSVSSIQVPKRYTLTSETLGVQKFVKLITQPSESNTIDDQIDQFKSLSDDKQKQLLSALENKPSSSENTLLFQLLTTTLPAESLKMILGKYNNLQSLDPTSSEYYKLRSWLEKLVSIPFGFYKPLPTTIDNGLEQCNIFMQKCQKNLEEAIYGQEEAKMNILQFIATKIANPSAHGTSLLLIGPPGIGKTSLIKNGIASALDWPFQFISLGGDSDASTYTGHQPVYEGSHCGKIVSSIIEAKSMSMILMFDELDKISTTPKGEEVQHLLVHLTDSVQNSEFEDKYLSGIKIDLSKIMFVFSGNDINRIDKVLLDRMNVVHLKGYSIKDKINIGERFIIRNALKEVALENQVIFPKDTLQHILEVHASEEEGVREFKRCIEQIVQKINMLRLFNTTTMPFAISDFALPFTVLKNHVEILLKRKTSSFDMSHHKMYT